MSDPYDPTDPTDPTERAAEQEAARKARERDSAPLILPAQPRIGGPTT